MNEAFEALLGQIVTRAVPLLSVKSLNTSSRSIEAGLESWSQRVMVLEYLFEDTFVDEEHQSNTLQ